MNEITTDPNDPRLGKGVDTDGPVLQHDAYLVLPKEEIAKGFVRPVRVSYRHVGPEGPKHPLRDLKPREKELYGMHGYVKFEDYRPDNNRAITGKFWTQKDLDAVGKGCNTITTMDRSIAETYARRPTFYGATYCCHCMKHLPVGEFVWLPDGTRVGS